MSMSKEERPLFSRVSTGVDLTTRKPLAGRRIRVTAEHKLAPASGRLIIII